jgi:phage-related protein (TIGR01555 family)
MQINDSLRNLASGMGTSRDKGAQSTYGRPRDDQRQEFINAFRGAWLPRRVVSQVAEDCFRNWRDWQADPAQISLIERTEKRLKLRDNMKRAKLMARLLGKAYVYISIKGDEGRLTEPLNPERVRRDGIYKLQVFNETEIVEGDIDIDPMSLGYGEPKYYEISSNTLVRVHPSRMVVLYGAERPQDWIFGRDADSILTATLDAIKRHDATVSNVASLVYESRVDVITIPGLADLLQDEDEYKSLLDRMALMARMKGNNGLVLLNGTTTPGDPTETWEQRNATFTTLPDIIEKAQEEVAAAARIPRALLFGTGAGGLGATGTLELSAYYDHIGTMQTNEIEPAMAILDECVIRSALGSRPPEIWYKWASLWQVSDKERSEIGERIINKWHKAKDFLPAEVCARAAINELTESGVGGGVEMFMSDWEQGGGELGADREVPEDIE